MSTAPPDMDPAQGLVYKGKINTNKSKNTAAHFIIQSLIHSDAGECSAL